MNYSAHRKKQERPVGAHPRLARMRNGIDQSAPRVQPVKERRIKNFRELQPGEKFAAFVSLIANY